MMSTENASNPAATYKVTGMNCEHCEKAVREEVSQLSGVSGLDVSAASGVLTVHFHEGAETPATDQDIIAAVDEAGYTAERA